MLRAYRMALPMALALVSTMLVPWERLLVASLAALSVAWTVYWVSMIVLGSIAMSLNVIILLTDTGVNFVSVLFCLKEG
jgi:hypothetical protein